MPGSDLPEGTANDTSDSVNFAQGVEDLTDILSDPDTDPNENEVKTDEAEPEAETEGNEPEEEADEEALELEAEPEPSDEADGPVEIKGGQFVPDTAKVTLADGSVISVAELKRNNLFQRDYTRKTEEIKQEREQLQTLQAQAHEVAQYRDFVLSMYQQVMPQPPDKSLMETDIIGYWQAKEQYDEQIRNLSQLQALKQHEDQQKSQSENVNYQNAVQREVGQLYEKLPYLKDQGKMQQFRTEVVDALAPYGFSADEVGSVIDHRMLLVAKDIVRLQKALKKAPQVKEQVQQKPKLISGGKRMDPKARTSREAQGRSERLRNSGTLESGVASLMDLDL